MAASASVLLSAGAGPAHAQVLSQNFDAWPLSLNWGTYTNGAWILSDGQVLNIRNGWAGAPHSTPNAAWLQSSSLSSNAWLQSPLMSNGVGRISFWARNAVDGGMNAFDVQTSTNGSDWATVSPLGHDNTVWTEFERTLNVRTSLFVRILKVADQGTNQYLGLDDVTIDPPPGVLLSNLRHLPSSPTVQDAVHVYVDAQVLPVASNVSFTAFYRFGFAGAYQSIAMALATGSTYRTATPIPAGFEGGVQYYVQCTYAGIGLSPVYAPDDSSNAPAYYSTSNPYSSLTGRQLSPSSRNTPLIISEIMYHPTPRADGRNLEYIELFNTEPMPHDVGGYRISGDVDFTFPSNTMLAARSFLVVARDPQAFEDVYEKTAYGPLSTNLPNGRGTVMLRNRSDAILLEVVYDTRMPWPIAADGTGHSLVLSCPDYGETSIKAWSASARVGGSPGDVDSSTNSPLDNVVINEFRAHTDPPDYDFIELYNHGTSTVNISGCWLSDQAGTNKFRIPDGTFLSARGFKSFSTNTYALGFELSMKGEDIFLVNPGGMRVLDAVRYEAQQNGVATGRFPDGGAGFQELVSATPGATNAPPWIRDVVINEIMYHPASGLDADTYVELYNRGSSPADVSYWRFTDGIDFMFAPGTVIPAHGYLVVANDADNLMATHLALNATNTVGNFGGSLSRSGERIALAKPDDLALPYQDFVVVDEVTYDDGWGKWTDGGGSSLELVDPHSDNRLVANWAGSDESHKAGWTTVECNGKLDFGNTSYPPGELHVIMRDSGECLVDNVDVHRNQESNLVPNATFESGVEGWLLQGTHRRSAWSTNEGYQSSGSLHVIASGDGDTGANHIETDFSGLSSSDTNVTIRARVRWLAGTPYILFRLLGNWLEAPGTMRLPVNLGTPGAQNSRYVTNAGPSIAEAAHAPVLPAPGGVLVVTARVADPDGIASVTLKYRLDPATSLTSVVMNDLGQSGDAVAGDGVFSATMPGQASGALAAFHILATDRAVPAASSVYPPGAPARECLILFGQSMPSGNFGVYRLWLTQGTRTLWATLPGLSNDPLDATLVYNDFRVLYEASARYRSSPFLRRSGDPLSVLSPMVLKAPRHDPLLGSTSFNLDDLATGRDDTYQRERMAFWIADRLDIPFTYQRYIHFFVNDTRKGVVFVDDNYPSGGYIDAWMPGQNEGELFEVNDWFEFNDSLGFNNVDATLQNFTTTGGAKKTERYRWNWGKKPGAAYADSYTSVFRLVDAINLTPGPLLDHRMSDQVDFEEWMRAFAVRHIAADWDGYSYSRGKNTYVYKPVNGKWRVLPWDLDFSLGGGSSGTSDPLFTIGDPALRDNFFSRPLFRRAYWRAMQDAVAGPLLATNCNPIMDANYKALQDNGIAIASPAAVKAWLADRRAYIMGQLQAVTNVPFAVTTGNYTTSSNPAPASGIAPVQVTSIRVNTNEYPITWTSETNWTVAAPLQAGTNVLEVTAWDSQSRLVGTGRVVITFADVPSVPVNELAINEIMYHSAVPLADFVEIMNTSTGRTFDISGYRLDGVDFTFPPGTFIRPGQYLVAAENLAGYIQSYSNSEAVAGVYAGTLDNGGETLRLLRPAGSNEWVLLDEVRYDNDAPWPSGADGGGASLQLIDPAQEHNRVGNWAATDPNSGYAWTFVSLPVTTINFNPRLAATNRLLCLYLTSAGQASVDNACLVTGSVAEDGTNKLRNGDFESPLSPHWTATLNHSTSYAAAEPHYAGNSGLLIRATGPGDASNCVRQDSLDLAQSTRYTLSLWYLPTPDADELVVEFPNTSPDLRHVISLSPTIPSDRLATPGAANTFSSYLPPFPDLWINEIMPSNTSFVADNHGEFDPWIELYNAGTGAVDLTSYRLSNKYPDLSTWAFPTGTTVAAGQRLLVWADASPAQSDSNSLHADFRLNTVSGLVVLARQYLSRTIIVDYLPYSGIASNRSCGSYPEGDASSRQVFQYPTPGTANTPTSTPAHVFINEWMADNKHTLPDPADSDFEDWFELFNADAIPANLGSYTLKNALAATNGYRLPPGTWIGAKSFMLVWADNETQQNGPGREVHVNFKLSSGGEQICLFTPDGQLVDVVDFGQQMTDVSQGRWPDGEPAVYFMNFPTPRAPNEIFLMSGEITGEVPSVSWPSTPGRQYRLDYVDSVMHTNWTEITTVTAISEITTVEDATAAGVVQRFYRVSELR